MRARAAATGRRPGKDQLDDVGTAQVEVVGHDGFEERPRPTRRVQHQRAGHLDLAHRQLPPVAASPVPRAQRGGDHPQPAFEEQQDVVGTQPVTDRLQPVGSSQDANPLDSAVKPIPAIVAWRLAHSCPLTHTFAGYELYPDVVDEELRDKGGVHSRNRK